MKKKFRFLYSMKFGVSLLVILTFVCVAGSFIQQGQIDNYYLNVYGESLGHLILALGVNDVFHCWWVIILAVFLCINLSFCSIIRFPVLMKRFKNGYTINRFDQVKPFRLDTTISYSEDIITKFGFTKNEKSDKRIYGVKGKAGIWGSWFIS